MVSRTSGCPCNFGVVVLLPFLGVSSLNLAPLVTPRGSLTGTHKAPPENDPKTAPAAEGFQDQAVDPLQPEVRAHAYGISRKDGLELDAWVNDAVEAIGADFIRQFGANRGCERKDRWRYWKSDWHLWFEKWVVQELRKMEAKDLGETLFTALRESVLEEYRHPSWEEVMEAERSAGRMA